MTLTWVVGAGGLIGGSLATALPDLFKAGPVPWQDQSQAVSVLGQHLGTFRKVARDDPWSIAWVAGAGTVATEADTLRRETTILAAFVTLLRDEPPAGPGAILLASSAGGLYAGARMAPFTSTDEPHPIGAYGAEKLAQERLVCAGLCERFPVVLARFSNVYGPRQNLAKSQGLISRLALAAVTRQSVNLFVPLDTIRDYIEADDAAFAAAYWLQCAVRRSALHDAVGAEVRIVASGRPTTVAELVGSISDIARRRIPVALGTDTSARLQPPDLRFVPDLPSGLPFPHTPLPVGLRRVVDAVLRQQQTRGPIAFG